MGFLLIFDVTNESSFLSIRDWLTHIDTYANIDQDLRPPIILVGNKIDLVQHRAVDSLRAQQLANELHVTYVETSAVTGTNVQHTLTLLVQHIFDFMDRSMQKYYLQTSITVRLSTHTDEYNELLSKKSNKHSCLCI
jgi:Ras-related protein Rab-27A